MNSIEIQIKDEFTKKNAKKAIIKLKTEGLMV